ncbi:oligosaccharide flippase family protein [Planococcus liqunii]|uniref:oligosaccharide flippase family protein n=1 Tax=Planococcus liqunii TaxID=3058394 RepID=UPI002637515C|nr:oligosaccharide flippase family protein [Planococcus sp. N056]WKA50171.1 oligosaccharide flippase family protein [Planococcus sp. N056]
MFEINLYNNIAKASFWSFLSEIVAKTIGPLLFLVMTMLLSPKDFGLVAVATVILGLVTVISDMGMSKVIIQESGTEKYLNQLYNVSFWFNIAMGIIVFLILFFFSSPIAELYGEPGASVILQVMSLEVIFFSLSSIQSAIKKKFLDFKSLFYIRLVTVCTPAIVSIPLAFMGAGFWAIVWGNVFGSFATTIVLWKKSKWKPRFYFNLDILKYILSKGIWSTFESLLVWVPVLLDTFLITKYLSSTSLGLYVTSKNLFTVAVGVLLGPLIPILFSSLSILKNDKAALSRAVLFSQKMIFAVSAMMGVFVFIFHDLIEKVIFTSDWNGLGQIFGIIFLVLGFEFFCSSIIEGFRAKGMFKVLAINVLVCTIISVPILFYAVQSSLVSYVTVRTLLLFLQFPILIFYSSKILDLKFSDYLINIRSTLWIVIALLAINTSFLLFDVSIEVKYAALFVVFIFALYLLVSIERKSFLKIIEHLSFERLLGKVIRKKKEV